MQLTDHFHDYEFTVSADFPEFAAEIILTPTDQERLRFGCAAILEPLRRFTGCPIHITSGKRDRRLNTAVDGHIDSHHMFLDDHGAFDFWLEETASTLVLPTPPKISQYLIDTTKFRYLIWYPDRRIFHLSLPDMETDNYNKYWIKGG